MAFLDETGLADFWNHILARLNNFVPAEAGKGLSSNDYTTAEKEKLASIAQGANNYTLPVATASKIGGVKSGTDITIDSSGNVSVNDDSHNHIISNVDGLQSALNDKVPSSRTVNGKALTSDISLTASNVGAISTTDGAVGTNNLASDAVQTGKIAAGAVTREKLAADALYSPTKIITADRNIEADDLGKTLWPKWASNNTTFTLNLDQSVSTGLPTGFEFAVCRMFAANRINISFSGIRVTQSGNGTITSKDQSITVTVPEIGGMFAMKKFDATSSVGDLWLLTGNAEVVS